MMQKRAVIYCRCSTEEETQIDALKKQVIEARTCVHEKGWILVDEFIESKSGTTVKGRTEYSRLFMNMDKPTFEVIVIKSQDRLMRNTKDWYLFLDRMLTNGKELYLYLDCKFYSTEDSLVTGIKAILAEDYSRELSKKIVNAHRHRQKNGGKVLLTKYAYGFLKCPDGSVQIAEEEAKVICRIYQYCAAGYGCRTIERILKEEGVRTRQGKYMTSSSIRRMIRNPLYKGIFVMNRTHYDFDTKRTIKNPPEEWIYGEGLIPPIVEEALWKQANDAMEKRAQDNNRNGKYRKGSNPGQYSLSGKIVCGLCGRPYYRTWRKRYADPSQRIVEWNCSTYMVEGTKKESFGCTSLHVNEEVLFSMLEQACDQYFTVSKLDKEKIIKKTVQILRKTFDKDKLVTDLEKMDREEQRYYAMKERLLNKLLDGVISDSDYKNKNQEMENKLSDIRNKKEKCREKEAEKLVFELRIAEIESRLEEDVYEKASVSGLLQDINRIIVYRTYLELEYDPVKILVPGQYGTGEKSIIRLEYQFPEKTRYKILRDKVQIMEYMEKNPEITAKKIADKMKIRVGMVQSRILALRKEGHIKYNGAGGSGTWEILKPIEELRRQMQE
jgi:DNA invertase Pin-like site-specific DNA recombinase